MDAFVKRCEHCGESIQETKRGRPQKFYSDRCRQAIRDVRFTLNSELAASPRKESALCHKRTRGQTRLSRYHHAGSVKNDNGMPTPSIRVTSGGSRLWSMATMLAPIIGAIAASNTVTRITCPSAPRSAAKSKRINAGARASLKKRP